MLIRKRSPYSGKNHEMDIDITKEQWQSFLNDELGLIQDAFPHLSADEREFLLTGITSKEWDELYKEVEDEEVNSD